MLAGMAERALYYPEWVVGDPRFLFESLLYWDQLAVMVPQDGYRPTMSHHDSKLSALLSTVQQKYVTAFAPDNDQKKAAHIRLLEVFENTASPEWLTPDKLKPTQMTSLAVDKLAGDTVHMLESSGWLKKAGKIDGFQTYNASEAAAYVVMAALAEACSSATMPPITRDAGWFMTSCNVLLAEIASPRGLSVGARVGSHLETPVRKDVDFLLEDIELPALARDPTATDFERLLEYREDARLNRLRKSYVKKVDEYLVQLRAAKGGERLAIREQFRAERKQSLSALHEELRQLRWDALCSKEGVCAVLFGVASAFAPIAAFGAAGALEATRRDYRQKRNEILAENWVSWASGLASARFTLV